MLRELVADKLIEKVPSGWKPTKAWALDEKTSEKSALDLLRKGVQLGLIEMKKFRIKTGDSIRPVPHYRIK